MTQLQPGFYWVTIQGMRLPAALCIEHSPLRPKPQLNWVLPGMCHSIEADQITNPVPCIEPDATDEQRQSVNCPTCGKMKLGEDAPATLRCTC